MDKWLAMTVPILGCSLGCLGTSFLSIILIFAILASLASCAGQVLVSGVKGVLGISSSSTTLQATSAPILALDAIALASHIKGPTLQNYDLFDPFMKSVISYWHSACPGSNPGSVCDDASNGGLQCVLFVTGAFSLAGISLPYHPDAHNFWPMYQNKDVQSNWTEIPVGTGLPQMGDIVVWRSWSYDAKQQARVQGAGHVAIVVAVIPPKGNTPGKAYLAAANIIDADKLPTVREVLDQDAGGGLINMLNDATLNARVGEMTIFPDLSVKDDKNLEDVYTHPTSSGSVVDGYIRYISPTSGSGKGYTVTGPPTISADLINQVLASYNSPAAGQGQALYDLGVQYGIDPVFALAFFMHESQFGTTGEARYTLSLGNERCIPDRPCIDQDRGGYAKMNSWADGFEHWYQLIKNLYVGQWHLSTVEQIVPVYAPSSDNNNVAAYIQSVEKAVDAWRGGKVQV